MSYDLFFTEPKVSRDDFFAYFGSRDNYELSEPQVLYQNENTGVYFVIDYDQGDDEADAPVACVAALNLNYIRPHFFGLEAVEEVSALVDHFGFSIVDPQNDGMGDGPFSRDGFLRGWNKGNEFGYAAILNGANAPETVWTQPGERLERIWEWNYKLVPAQESFTEDRFVPRIFFMVLGGQAVSAAVWPDAISELIPEVDYLLIGRQELAHKGLLGRGRKESFVVPFKEIAADVTPYAVSQYSLPAYSLPAPRVPEPIRDRVRKLQAGQAPGELLSMDHVLDAEIVARVRAGRGG